LPIAVDPLESLRPAVPGDVVALNSGGPPMTISSIPTGASEAVVLWFERGQCLEVRLPLAALSICNPLRRAEWPYGRRPALYAIQTPSSFAGEAEASVTDPFLARIGPPEHVPTPGSVASAQ
jgi:hypothetical protein